MTPFLKECTLSLFLLHLSFKKKNYIIQFECSKKSAMSNLYVITKRTRAQMQRLFFAKSRAFFFVTATSLMRKYALHARLIKCWKCEGHSHGNWPYKVTFCLISPGVRLHQSSSGNESRITENLDDKEILEKYSTDQPSSSTAVNETQLQPQMMWIQGQTFMINIFQIYSH